MKILVTGATGFIGNHIIELLIKEGNIVVASSSDRNKASKFKWFDKVIYKEYKIGKTIQPTDLYNYFESPEKIIHLAWDGLPNFKSLSHFEENLWAQYFFLKVLINSGVKDVTVTGTCLEYGLKEGQLHEYDCVSPITAYGIAKNTLRLFLEQLAKTIPFSLKWIRLFYLYGPGQHVKSILPQLQAALDRGDKEFKMSGGEQIRDYLPVEKVAENIIRIALQNKVTGIINCCSNNPITINQLVEDYLKKTKRSIKFIRGAYPYPDYEPMRFWGDNEKLNKIITRIEQ